MLHAAFDRLSVSHRASYCKRVGKILDHKDCHVVDAMTQPGLYLYKRPVRGGSGGGGGSMLSAEKLLEQAGSIMHHIVLYVKADDEVSFWGGREGGRQALLTL